MPRLRTGEVVAAEKVADQAASVGHEAVRPFVQGACPNALGVAVAGPVSVHWCQVSVVGRAARAASAAEGDVRPLDTAEDIPPVAVVAGVVLEQLVEMSYLLRKVGPCEQDVEVHQFADLSLGSPSAAGEPGENVVQVAPDGDAVGAVGGDGGGAAAAAAVAVAVDVAGDVVVAAAVAAAAVAAHTAAAGVAA